MDSAALAPDVVEAIRARTSRLIKAWLAVIGVLFLLALVTGGDGIASVVMLMLTGVVLLYTRAARTLKAGTSVPARLTKGPVKMIAAELPVEKLLPMWVVHLQYELGGEARESFFLLFGDEALVGDGGQATVVVDPDNGTMRAPVTASGSATGAAVTETGAETATEAATATGTVTGTGAVTEATHAVVSRPLAGAASPGGAASAGADRCTSCGNRLRLVDRHCDSCGTAMPDSQRAALQALLEDKRSARLQTSRKIGADVNRAAAAIAALAVLFLIAGVALFFIQRGSSQEALASLAHHPADATFTVEGETYTVEQAREELRAAPGQALLVNIVLAVIMLGLWLWARSSPLPAVIKSLCVFVAVHLVSALIDPTTLIQGLPIKIFAIVTLAAGVRAALQQRALRAPEPGRAG